jgi:Lrp/AsnC family transcriptional regulator, regulator for asnA, asnC and gidA
MTELNAPPMRRATVPPPTPATTSGSTSASTSDGAPTGMPARVPARVRGPAPPSRPTSATTGAKPGQQAAATHRQSPATGSAGAVQLDAIAKLIIEQLQQDGRRSYAAIGKAVGLSEAAVRQRVQKLLETGVMQIVAVTDPLMLGFQRQVMIAIKCDGDLVAVADQLAEMDEIDYVVVTAGSFDILVELVCESDEQLLELLGRVRSVPTVTSTETFVYLKLRKQTYSWGTR